ncbi:MAG: CRISPR-associated CARF protein Csa3 [Caldanaerobacter sp.]
MPIGFHEDIILRAMNHLHVKEEDTVYTVTCGPLTGAVKRAVESLKAMCLRQGFSEPTLIELSCKDFYGSIRTLRKTIEKHKDQEIYLCTGAGLRIITHMIEIALLATKKTFNIYYEPETEGVEPILAPHHLILNIYKNPSGLEHQVLKTVIENPGISVNEISEKLKVKEKTVRNILTRLKNMGLITKTGKGKVAATPVATALYS